MTRKLDADERPRTLYTAIVSGKGTFPVDMLRYDTCYPSRTEDAVSISLTPSEAALHDGKRQVRVCSYFQFTPERWDSFGWECRVD